MRLFIGRLILGCFLSVAVFGFLFPDLAVAKKKKITITDEIKVQGKIVRPEMSLILQRSKMNYEALKLREGFLDRIVQSVKQGGF